MAVIDAAKRTAVDQGIFTLPLTDGLPVTQEGKPVRYKTVRLRETTVVHELKAHELSEKLMQLPRGEWQLVSNAEVFTTVMTMLACECFIEAGLETIDEHVLDLALFGKLSRHDLTAIEERVALIELASQLRHGLITEREFIAVQQQVLTPGAVPEKRPEGEAEATVAASEHTGATVEVLADNTPKSN